MPIQATIQATPTVATALLAAGLLASCGTPQEAANEPGGTAISDPDPLVVPEPPAPEPTVRFVLAVDGLPERAMWKGDPVFADFNGDGHVDMAAIPRLSDGPRAWLGDGAGNWTESSDGMRGTFSSCGGGIEVVDMDGDGILDLVVACHCEGIFVFRNDGDANWEMITERLNPDIVIDDPDEAAMFIGAEDVGVGDVNGDGHLDLVACSSDRGGMQLYLGDGTGRNWTREPSTLVSTGWGMRVDILDIDGDGHDDVLGTCSTGPRVWRGDGTGRLVEASTGLPTPMMQGIYMGMDVADMNRDGRLDLVLANWVDGPEVHLQQPDGSWRKLPDIFPDMLGGAIGIAAGDVDGDGNNDIAVTGRLTLEGGFSRGVFVLLGDGDGNFEWESDAGLPDEGLMAVGGLGMGDIDGDGRMDVAVGTGLITETGGERRTPILDCKLPAWRTVDPDEGVAQTNDNEGRRTGRGGTENQSASR